MNGVVGSDGSVHRGVHLARSRASSMWLSSRQTYSQVRSHFSVHDALV